MFFMRTTHGSSVRPTLSDTAGITLLLLFCRGVVEVEEDVAAATIVECCVCVCVDEEEEEEEDDDSVVEVPIILVVSTSDEGAGTCLLVL